LTGTLTACKAHKEICSESSCAAGKDTLFRYSQRAYLCVIGCRGCLQVLQLVQVHFHREQIALLDKALSPIKKALQALQDK
jgi:hypothetical protein